MKLNKSRKSEYLTKLIKKSYKDIALQTQVISPNANDQLKRIFVLLGFLKCGNQKNILSKLSALLDKLYKN